MSTALLRRLLLVTSLVLLLLSAAWPAMAGETFVLATAENEEEPPAEGATGEEAPAEGEQAPAEGEEAPAAVPPALVPTPAVEVEPEAASEPTPEWTFRFLLPTTLLLGGLAVVGTTIAYFVKVTKARYRVVE